MNALYRLITSGTARSDDAVANGDDFFEHSEKIIQLKHNDPNAASLELKDEAFNNRAWRRLGVILAQNTCLKRLDIYGGNLDVVGLCTGLQHNYHIQGINFTDIDFSDPEKMHALAPFLRNNPSLEEIGLMYCNLGPAGGNILSAALEARSLGTLRCLDLMGNNLGDIAVDRLIQVLRQSGKVEILALAGNGIGQKGCVSIATMLKDPQSNLRRLWLGGNRLTDESVATLAHSLAENTRLASLWLVGNTQITSAGWTAVKDLVFNTVSMTDVVKSNHTLKNVYMGVGSSELLLASLKLNRNQNKRLVVRQKVIWGHAEGHFNIALSLIGITALPVMLSWFTDESSPNSVLLPHQETARLDAIYRIVRSRPDLFQARQNEDSKLRKLVPWMGAIGMLILALVFQIVMQH